MKTGLNQNIKFFQKIKKFIVVLILLVFVFLVLNLTGYSKKIKDFLFFASSPFQKIFWQAGKSASSRLEAKPLKEELIEQNEELLSRIVETIEIKKENENLRTALGLGLKKEFRLTLARVISKDISRDSILINKGKRDGVEEGYPVITGEKILFGRVGQVYERFSEVVLISNKESFFDAKIIKLPLILQEKEENEEAEEKDSALGLSSAKDEIYGIVRGKGDLKLYFDLIPKEKEVSEGDLIVTSVLEGVYPHGLLVGRIKAVESSDVETFQKSEINPFFRISKPDYLFILMEF